VAALVGEDATLKIYIPQGNKVLLLPANASYDPIVFERNSPDRLQILGIAVGLVRRDLSYSMINLN
jgi:SOS-response transcriptional repressor LexA